MAMQKGTHQSRGKYPRLILFIIAGIALAIGASLWILSILNIIPGSWSTFLAIPLPVIAVLFTLLQWLAPLPSGEPTSSTSTPPTPVFIQVPSISPTKSEIMINTGKAFPISQDARKDFFISYSDEDQKWAEWIAWQLEAEGFSTVLPDWDFLPGANLDEEMEKAVKEAKRTILVLSPTYLKEHKNRRGWLAALTQDQSDKQSRLIPICVEDCKAELARIASLRSIDLFGLDEAKARQKLLEGVRLERAKPSVAPSFPGRVTA